MQDASRERLQKTFPTDKHVHLAIKIQDQPTTQEVRGVEPVSSRASLPKAALDHSRSQATSPYLNTKLLRNWLLLPVLRSSLDPRTELHPGEKNCKVCGIVSGSAHGQESAPVFLFVL